MLPFLFSDQPGLNVLIVAVGLHGVIDRVSDRILEISYQFRVNGAELCANCLVKGLRTDPDHHGGASLSRIPVDAPRWMLNCLFGSANG